MIGNDSTSKEQHMISACRVWTICVTLTLFSLTFCFTEHSALAVSLQVDGQDGADGVAGDPGTAGEDGTAGSDVTNDIGDEFSFFSFGTLGGNGGIGGDGLDGDDEGSAAQGGNGGNAGVGGDASVTRSAIDGTGFFFSLGAVGGRGGDGGKGGFGTSRELDGIGGFGGNGGRAVVDVDVDNAAQLSARGGNGGIASGIGGVAGDGARPFVKARLLETFQFASISQTGGDAGTGFDGANGGRGAASTIGFNPEQLVFDPPANDDRRDLNFNLAGGKGGDSVNGTVGRGGTARLNLASITDAINSSTNFNVSATIRAGQGGRGFSTGRQDTDGVGGAIAVLKTSEDLRLTSGIFTLRGGNGGSALGRQNQGNGGHGASAIVDGPLRLEGPAGQSPFLMLDLVGGMGGHAQGTGFSGNGASVVAPEIQIQSDSFISLDVSAVGGDGGWGQRNGSGGDATVEYESDQPDSEITNSVARGIYRAEAVGGNAGQGLNPITSATGGDAVAELSQTRRSSLFLQSLASAGFGQNGSSGSATATTFAHSLASGSEQGVIDTSASSIATTRDSRAGNFRPSVGTTSTAEATAINENRSSVEANATAIGGFGFLQGGDATATATSQNLTAGFSSTATTLARGLGSSNVDIGRISESTSVADSVIGGFSSAFATAERTGQNVTSKSSSIATGSLVSSTSRATTMSTALQHSASVRTTSSTNNFADQLITAETLSVVQFASDEAIAQPVFDGQMTAALLVNPQADQVADFIETESEFGDVFLDSDANIFGVGSIFASGSENTDLTSTASFDLELEVQEFQSGGRFQLGFFGLGEDSSGFSELEFEAILNDRLFVEEQLNSAEEAIAFFDNRLFDVTDTALSGDVFDLELRISFVSENASDLFGLGFVFGNVNEAGGAEARFAFSSFSAVPEPGSAVVLLATGLLVAFRRRR